MHKTNGGCSKAAALGPQGSYLEDGASLPGRIARCCLVSLLVVSWRLISETPGPLACVERP